MVNQESFVRYEAFDANLVCLLHRLRQVVGRLHPVPRLGAAAERLVQANRHLG